MFSLNLYRYKHLWNVFHTRTYAPSHIYLLEILKEQENRGSASWYAFRKTNIFRLAGFFCNRVFRSTGFFPENRNIMSKNRIFRKWDLSYFPFFASFGYSGSRNCPDLLDFHHSFSHFPSFPGLPRFSEISQFSVIFRASFSIIFLLRVHSSEIFGIDLGCRKKTEIGITFRWIGIRKNEIGFFGKPWLCAIPEFSGFPGFRAVPDLPDFL